MTKLRVGRFGVDVVSGEVQTVDSDGSRVSVAAVTAYSDREQSLALRQQLMGYVDSPDEDFVPVLWSEDPTIAGYYRVVSASTSEAAGLAPYGVLSFSVELERVPGYAAPLVETIVLGKRRRDAYAVGYAVDAVISAPAGVGSYANFDPEAVLVFGREPKYVREGESGSVGVYTESSAGLLYAQFYVAPELFYEGAATLRVGSPSRVVTGRQIPNRAQWRLSNGLFELEPTGSDLFELRCRMWSDGAWTPWWAVQMVAGSSTSPDGSMAAPHTITVLRNSPEAVTIRLLTTTVSGSAPVTVDMTLRRGGRYVTVELVSVLSAEFGVRVLTVAITPGTSRGPYFSWSASPGTVLAVMSADPAGLTRAVVHPYVDLVRFVDRWSFALALFPTSEGVEQTYSEYMWAGTEKQSVVAQ